MKRTLAFLLALLILFSLVPPTAAKAAESDSAAPYRDYIHRKKPDSAKITDDSFHIREDLSGALWVGEDVRIEGDVVLTENTVVDYGAMVFIDKGVTLTVPAGVEFIIQGYVEVYGTIIVQPGGSLIITNEYVNSLNIWSGKLDVTGADLSGIPYGSVGIRQYSGAQVLGMPKEMLTGIRVISDRGALRFATRDAAEYYYFIALSDKSFTLSGLIPIPENMEWIHIKDPNERHSNVSAYYNAVLINRGLITIGSGAGLYMGESCLLVNQGGLLFSEDATFTMDGTFVQEGVYEGPEWEPDSIMYQRELEAALADCVATGQDYVLEQTVYITSDMTINTGDQIFSVGQNGSIAVLFGAILTIDSTVKTFDGLNHGKIVVSDGGKLIINGELWTSEKATDEFIIDSYSHVVLNGNLYANGTIRMRSEALLEIYGNWIGYAPSNFNSTILPAATSISLQPEKTRIDISKDESVKIKVTVTPATVHAAEWSFSDRTMVDTYKALGNGEYKIIFAGKAGPLTVTATSIDGSKKKATVELFLFNGDLAAIASVPMYRMYDPNSGEHFYTGAEAERDFLVSMGWHYEGVAFNFPEEGAPVYRLYEPISGEHLYTMDETEVTKLLEAGWNNEGVAFNSAPSTEVPQYRLHNPNATRGAYHFTSSQEECNFLLLQGWIEQGIGWYSCYE